ncbi:MAG: hypothetical protein HYV41_05615 [Candidatus Magasanikbacteria bacterium]|nr:hypothetical protein [Candidatus Magasanikbacteria bacterium]
MGDIPNNRGGEHGRTPRIDFQEVMEAGRLSNKQAVIVWKNYNIQHPILQNKMAELNISPAIVRRLENPTLVKSGRHLSHFIRLLERPGVEQDFAISFIRNATTIFEEEKNKISDGSISDDNNILSANYLLGDEGSNTTIFWTFAPYVYKALIERGIDAQTAIEKILTWAKHAYDILDADKDYTKGSFRVDLPGLSHITDEYILNSNPQHISHKFTEQEAGPIADLLIKEDSNAKET